MANMASACALVMSTGDNAKLFGPLRYWRARQAASTCILVTISAICVCILVVCGVLLAREYSLAKGYERTACTVSNVTYAAQERSCHFCSGHKDKSREKGTTGACVVSAFPCLRILVVYNSGSTVHEALLHTDSLQAAGVYRECSFSVCMKDREDNHKAAEEFAVRWRTRQRSEPFECYYNTQDSEDVIAEKVYTQSDVIHSMLWPSVVIVVCCAVFLRLETQRRHLTFCGSAPPPGESSAECSSRGATPEALDMRVVMRGASLGPTMTSSVGGALRLFPTVAPNGAVECRLVSRTGSDVIVGGGGSKAWKSYSSLEKLIAVPHKSSAVTSSTGNSGIVNVAGGRSGRTVENKSRSVELILDGRAGSLTADVMTRDGESDS